MRLTVFQRRLVVAISGFFLFLAAAAASALFLRVEQGPLAEFEVLSISPPQPNGMRSASVLIRNISDGTIQYECAMAKSKEDIRPRCEFLQETQDGAKRWSSEPSRSSRFLFLGQEVRAQIEFPSGGPVTAGIYMLKLPAVAYPGSGFWNRLKLAVLGIRVRIAAQKGYEPCWLPEPLAAPSYQESL